MLADQFKTNFLRDNTGSAYRKKTLQLIDFRKQSKQDLDICDWLFNCWFHFSIAKPPSFLAKSKDFCFVYLTNMLFPILHYHSSELQNLSSCASILILLKLTCTFYNWLVISFISNLNVENSSTCTTSKPTTTVWGLYHIL